ncbi:MAG TPA: amidophosphoribosyltransferase [Thermaerobacter sp.]
MRAGDPVTKWARRVARDAAGPGAPGPADGGAVPAEVPFFPELREECGVFGIWRHPRAVPLTCQALYALQHRGQDSAGIAACHPGGSLVVEKAMGLVSEVFTPARLDRLVAAGPFQAAVGHVRYTTTGGSRPENAQPLVFQGAGVPFALAHNGQLVGSEEMRQWLRGQGIRFITSSDSEVMGCLAEFLMRNAAGGNHPGAGCPGGVGSREDAGARGAGAEGVAGAGGRVCRALVDALSRVRGAFAVVALTPAGLLAARDPRGIRPLVLGRLEEAWVVASETCAFDTIGAETIRELEPGEWLWIDDRGLRGGRLAWAGAARGATPGPAFCVFELVYFARPDSRFGDRSIYEVRKELGRRLAREHPVAADVVIGVPDSSLPAATGYSEESGIPHELGLIKNRYAGRTFIRPDPRLRAEGVRIKLNPIPEVVAGRRVVLVDDSLVRGTTARRLVRALREAGAREVHLRITSPPYRHSCFYGVDTADREKLIAARHGVDEIRRLVGADSLHFLSLEGMVAATGCAPQAFCLGCFTGEYPVPPGTPGPWPDAVARARAEMPARGPAAGGGTDRSARFPAAAGEERAWLGT